jgi:hypothetical protein
MSAAPHLVHDGLGRRCEPNDRASSLPTLSRGWPPRRPRCPAHCQGADPTDDLRVAHDDSFRAEGVVAGVEPSPWTRPTNDLLTVIRFDRLQGSCTKIDVSGI